MPTVVYRPKNKYAQNKPNNEYGYKNLNKRIELLINRVDALLNRL
jgi:hypothetical protein